MPLGTKVNPGPGHTVLHGDSAGAQPRNFRPMSIVAKRSPISASDNFYKCSVVAEMGDRLATIDTGLKLGGCAPFGRVSWVLM